MKIILLINSLYTGGAEFSTLTFYQWLKNGKTKVDVHLVCLKEATPSYSHAEFGFDNITYLKSKTILNKVQDFNKIIAKLKPQIVHSVLFDANIVGRISRVTSAYTFCHLESLVNQTYSSQRLKDPNINKVKLNIYRLIDFLTQAIGTDHFHSNGATVAEHYIEKLKINKNKITNIPRGRYSNPYLNDECVIRQIRKELNAEERILIVNVARHEFQKAQLVILEALNCLHNLNKDYLLVLIGREGESTKEIFNKISEYGLEGQVKILGHRNDVNKILAAADIFVFPSRFEGLPGALIEAEAAGLPVICSNIPNNLEVVDARRNAMVFPVDDYKVFSLQLKTLVNNAIKRKKMGENGLEIFNKKFLIEEIHNKMWKMISSLNKHTSNNYF